MSTQLEALLEEANAWLAQRKAPAPHTAEWCALNNLRTFIRDIEQDKSAESIARAVHALRHHIVDQFDCSADYCDAISLICDRADNILLGMRRKR